MASKFTTSVNIIRDANKQFEYIATPNAVRIAEQLGHDFRSGIHSFILIGSYGTGKSSFLMAFDQSLRAKGTFKLDFGFKPKNIKSIQIVGQYQSLIKYFHELLDIQDDFDGNQKIFDSLYRLSEENNLLVIYLDEFGKFLEYASKHNPEKELYFLQQLAEFVNDHNRNIILISTLHQNFEAYGAHIADDSQKKEWRKVKGRFKELTFNEPVEQLLYLAAKKLNGRGKLSEDYLDLAIKKHILPFSAESVKQIEGDLAPLDIISAAVLTKSLQQYGQNERSLFTFLESDLKSENWANVPLIYDYLLASFYSFLNSAYNTQYRNWQGMQAGIERIEVGDIASRAIKLDLFKTIGLLQLFAAKSAQVDKEMLQSYFKSLYSYDEIENALQELEKKSIVRFTKFNNSYKIIEGTDVDFDQELIKAEEAVDRSFDLISSLLEHFDFPYIQAKEASYNTGTPRIFGFKISENPINDIKPEGAIDGYINLVFNEEKDCINIIKKVSCKQEEAILYGFFTNAKAIQEHIYEILKTKKVLSDNREDHVAKQEFEKILASHEKLLSHEVLGSLYTNKVSWIFNGKEIQGISNQQKLNVALSQICRKVYCKTPKFNNELLNKHKISTSIHTARKNYFQRLTEFWDKRDCGFEKEKFPPEKTIYKSLLVDNEMHKNIEGTWELKEPCAKNGFDEIWRISKFFLDSSREEKRSISELYDLLSEKPYKLKQGLIDFWVPTFLFINRGDFALYENGKFIPYLNDTILYMLTRQVDSFQIKAFEISGLRLKVFNKYREFLEQGKKSMLSKDGFIQSVRPFLVFYKNLNEYAKNTSRLSSEATELRKAIVDAQDPEKTFFETIPRALKMDIQSFESSDEQLAAFASKLNEAIDEIKNAYAELLNRFERFITSEIFNKKLNFEEYKNALAKRYKEVKEHRLLPRQKVFLARLNSPLDDRDSWLASIGQSLIGKPLDRITDQEEEILKDRMIHMIQELDNLQAIHKVKAEEGEQIFKLDLTSEGGTKSTNVRISKEKMDEVDKSSDAIEKLLGKNKQIRLAVLSKLINKELNK